MTAPEATAAYRAVHPALHVGYEEWQKRMAVLGDQLHALPAIDGLHPCKRTEAGSYEWRVLYRLEAGTDLPDGFEVTGEESGVCRDGVLRQFIEVEPCERITCDGPTMLLAGFTGLNEKPNFHGHNGEVVMFFDDGEPSPEFEERAEVLGWQRIALYQFRGIYEQDAA